MTAGDGAERVRQDVGILLEKPIFTVLRTALGQGRTWSAKRAALVGWFPVGARIIEGEENQRQPMLDQSTLVEAHSLPRLKSTGRRIGSRVHVGSLCVELPEKFTCGVVEGGPDRVGHSGSESKRSGTNEVGTLPDFYRRRMGGGGRRTGVPLKTMRGDDANCT